MQKTQTLTQQSNDTRDGTHGFYIACDVDGTIASRVKALARFYNLRLNLWPEGSMYFQSYEDVYNHPAFKIWRKINPELFQKLQQEARESLQIMRDCEPMEKAAETLQTCGEVAFYTIRRVKDADMQKEIELLTRGWLRQYGFFGEVYFPHNFMQKLVMIFKHAEAAGKTHAILYDDRVEDLLQAYNDLRQRFPDNPKIKAWGENGRLTLVAVGADRAPNMLTHGITVVAMPTWGHW